MSLLPVKDPKELIIIDGNIGDIENILSNLRKNQEYIILSGGNGFVPLLEYLEIFGTEWFAFHFITHGNDASFMLNGTMVSQDNLCSEDWSNIGKYLTDDGDILLYGCNIAASEEGKALVNAIASLTGADTAASVDITGFGGNNVLEYHSGTIETASFLPETFNQSLEVITNPTTIATSSSATFTDTTFSVRMSSYDGGGAVYNEGIFAANSCYFWNNKASRGGAVYNKYYYLGSTFTADNCSFSGNSASNGGAVFNSRMFTATSCSFSGNTATNGGAVYNSGTFNATSCMFSLNKGRVYGGAVYNSRIFTATFCTFSSNTIMYKDLGIIGDTTTFSKGGAVYNSGTFTADYCTFSDNTASSEGTVYFEGMVPGSGGAVYNESGMFIANFCTFSDNTASPGGTSSGGAVYNESGTFSANNSMFSHNKVGSKGGAVYNNSGVFTATSCTFNFNGNSAVSGGVVYNFNGTFTADHCNFSLNSASRGGVVYNSGTFTADTSSFSGNSASDGGAVHNSGTFTADHCYFSRNRASLGGAVYNSSTFTANFCTFSENTASNGGAVYNAGTGTIFLTDCSFTTENDKIYNAGTLNLSGANTFGGAVNNNGTVVFNLSNMVSGNEYAIINDISKFSGTGSYHIQISEEQAYGTYLLAGKATNFDKTVTLLVSSSERTLSANNGPVFFDGLLFQLKKKTQNLLFTFADTAIITDGGTTDTLTFNGVTYTGGALTKDYLKDVLAKLKTVVASRIISETRLTIRNGAVFATDNVCFANSMSSANGGAVYNSGTFTATSGTFSGNSATQGGAVYNDESGTIFLTDCSFTTENDTIYNAGTLNLSGANTFGGAVTNIGTVVFDISDMASGNQVAIINDISQFSGGSYHIRLSEVPINGTYLLAGNAAGFSTTVTLCIGSSEKTISADNEPVFFDGFSFQLKKEDKDDGTQNLSLNVSDTAIITSEGTTDTLTINGVTYTGGALTKDDLESALANLKTVAASGITSETSLDVQRGAVFATDNVCFANSMSNANGGAVSNNGSTFTANGSTFKGNSAMQGGAVSNTGTFMANNNTFSQNTADSGGAVFNNSNTTVQASSFSQNTADSGGAVFNTGKFTANTSTFSGNSATDDGGVVYNQYGTFTANSSMFNGNTAEQGGAVDNYRGTFTATDSTFSNNSATDDGGAVYNKSGTFMVNTSTFSKNTASKGGAIYQDSGTLIIRNSSFLTASDTICIEDGSATFDGKISLAGNLYSKNAISVEEGTEITFDLSSYTSGNTVAIITNLDTILTSDCGAVYSVRLNGEQAYGKYLLATGATARTISVVCGDKTLVDSMTVGEIKYVVTGSNVNVLQLVLEDKALYFTISESLITLSSLKRNLDSTEPGGTLILSDDVSYNEVADLVFDGITIAAKKTIKGAGYTVDAGSEKKLFEVTESGDLTLDNVALYNAIAGNGGAMYNEGRFTATSCTFSGNSATQGGAVYNDKNGTVFLNDCSFTTESDTVYNAGILTLSGTNTFGGAVTNEGTVVFDLSDMTFGNDTLIVDDFSKFSGSGSYSVTISDEHAIGTYLLAGNAESFTESISVTGFTDGTTLVLGVNVAREYEDRNYILSRNDENQLFLQISKDIAVTELAGDKDGVTWESTGESSAKAVFAADDSFSGVLSVNTNVKNAVATYGVPETGISWGVQSGGDMIQTAKEAISGERSGTPSQLTAQEDGVTDLFFAGVLGHWEIGYVAKHTGNENGWEGTGERVYLAGKNKIGDIITGTADANILVLTDDANGDALFIDDLYTDAPEDIKGDSRLAKIQEIRAGAGNDVIDLTSPRFSYASHQSGLTVRGGSGNDVIWANNGSNFLFGDDGDDRIVGGNGNDVISGGSGNDQLHGGGGDDVFTFCEGWGEDTVVQLDGGSVTLWFASGDIRNWNDKTLTYRDDSGNSVTVSGVTEDKVSLKFGDDGSAEYKQLSAQGAFSEKTSEKIFETDKTLLA